MKFNFRKSLNARKFKINFKDCKRLNAFNHIKHHFPVFVFLSQFDDRERYRKFFSLFVSFSQETNLFSSCKIIILFTRGILLLHLFVNRLNYRGFTIRRIFAVIELGNERLWCSRKVVFGDGFHPGMKS